MRHDCGGNQIRRDFRLMPGNLLAEIRPRLVNNTNQIGLRQRQFLVAKARMGEQIIYEAFQAIGTFF